MSTHHSTGGVSNLRAIFETKTSEERSASPPSRGRSPALSDASLHSRPLSKARASFVVVERSGGPEDVQQWGLRKASDVTTMADIKDELGNGSLLNGAADTPSKSPPSKDTQSNGVCKESEPHIQSLISSEKIDDGLGGILKGSAFEAGSGTAKAEQHIADAGEPSPPSKTPHANAAEATSNGKPSPKTQSKRPSQSIRTKITDPVASSHAQAPHSEKLNTTPNAKPIKTPPTRQVPPPQPSTVSPTSPRTPRTPKTPKSTVSPTMTKPPTKGSSGKPVAVAESANNASSKVEAPQSPMLLEETQTTSEAPATTRGTAASVRTSVAKNDAKPTPSPDTKLKSRAMPGAAAAATAPTAASLARNHNSTGLARKPTVTKRERPPVKSAAPTALAGKRASRSSISTTQAEKGDATKSRTSTGRKAPGDGFLARMMRPTASSAQKAHEKIGSASPPQARRTAPKSTTRGHIRRSVTLSEEDKENSRQGGQEVDDLPSRAASTQVELNRTNGAKPQPLSDITPARESVEAMAEPEPETVEGSNG